MIYCTSIRIFSVITLGLDINLIKVFILQTPINYNHHYILFLRNNFIFRRLKEMFLGLFLLILLVCDFNNFNISRGIRTYHHLPTIYPLPLDLHMLTEHQCQNDLQIISSTSIDIFQDDVSVTNSGYIIKINTGGSY